MKPSEVFLELYPAIRSWLSGPRARHAVCKRFFIWISRHQGYDALDDCVRKDWPETIQARNEVSIAPP